jgi:adenine-specific DNA-methyltransferase
MSELISSSKATLKSQFPSTRYQGSKRKILPWMCDALRDIKFETVLDGMGGSGMVSYMFKKMGKQVTCNDKLRFNYLIAKALIENNSEALPSSTAQWLLSLNKNVHYGNFIQAQFAGVYYTDDENRILDRIVSNIRALPTESTDDEFRKAIAYYALFQSCLIKRPFNLFHRKNLYLRTAQVPRSFSNYKTWNRPLEEYFLKFITEINSFIIHSAKSCQASNQSIFDINDQFDLVYLDPPYFRNNSDNETSNYLKCYHFLEGLANYDSWPSLVDKSSNIGCLKNSEDSKDFTRFNCEAKFGELLEMFSNSILVVSYKSGGIPSIDWWVESMRSVGKKTTVLTKKYSYALNKQNGNAVYNREALIIGE